METLQLKHLASYLPYELKGYYLDSEVLGTVVKLETYRVSGRTVYGNKVPIGDRISYFKPILRPLSDLTKEIEHNGERFIPNDRVCYWENKELAKTNILDMPYKWILRLFEWHFDIFDLIGHNLAIDINTLNNG